MTEKQAAIRTVLEAFLAVKAESNFDARQEKVDAFFDALGKVDTGECILPMLEIIYEIASATAAENQSTPEEVINGLSRVPSPV